MSAYLVVDLDLLRSKRIAVVLICALKHMICINSYNNRMKLLDDRTSPITTLGYWKKINNRRHESEKLDEINRDTASQYQN